MSKLKQNSLFVVRKYLLFTGKLYFSQTTNFTEVVASFASYVATALPVNSVGVTTPAKKNYVGPPPLEFGGLNPFLGFGGLSPPSPYVEPPLPHTLIQQTFPLATALPVN